MTVLPFAAGPEDHSSGPADRGIVEVSLVFEFFFGAVLGFAAQGPPSVADVGDDEWNESDTILMALRVNSLDDEL